MGKFKDLFFVFFSPRNTQKWANVAFRAFFPPKNTQKWTNLGFRAFLPPSEKTEKWVSVNLRTFLPPKHSDMGHLGLLGLFFLRNTQKWTIWTLGPFFFYPKPLRNGSIWLLGPPFPPEILRNVQMCILGPLFFPPEHSEMGQFGF